MTRDFVVVRHVIAYTVDSIKPVALLMPFSPPSLAQPPSPSTSLPKAGSVTSAFYQKPGAKGPAKWATLQAVASSRAIDRSLRKVRRRPGAGEEDATRGAHVLSSKYPDTLTVCACIGSEDTRIPYPSLLPALGLYCVSSPRSSRIPYSFSFACTRSILCLVPALVLVIVSVVLCEVAHICAASVFRLLTKRIIHFIVIMMMICEQASYA